MAEPELEDADSLLVIHPDRAPASALVPLLEHGGKRGFVVVDVPDVDVFSPIEQVALLVARKAAPLQATAESVRQHGVEI